MDLVELFVNCAYKVKYEECGEKVNYAFVEDGRTLYIYFQPSRGEVDWRHNFAFWKKPYKDMEIAYRVHGGFLKCWKYVEDIIIAKITEKEIDDTFKWTRVITVGYSHGAALAAFCHECIWFHRADLRGDGFETYAFEGPRVYAGFVIKATIKERWDGFYLFRNAHDIVTHVPPVLFGFRHVGELVQIGKKPSLWNAFKDMIKCAAKRDWSGAKVSFRILVGVRAHYPEEVKMSLENDRSGD